jgi:hypothetical protein
MRQQLIPLAITSVDPPSTADSVGFGFSPNDGQTYVIKSPEIHRLLPATEAFCEWLGAACQLPVTNGAWVDLNGTSCYGSRWEGGLQKDYINENGEVSFTTLKKMWQESTKPSIATAIFAFDLFVNNFDRHFGNYAIQRQNNNFTIRIYDFSRSWWVCADNLSNLPLPSEMKKMPSPDQRTCDTYKMIQKWIGGNDLSAARNVLNLLLQISTELVDRYINTMPTGWLDQQVIDSTLSWWDSSARKARIEDIEQGLKNGTLF